MYLIAVLLCVLLVLFWLAVCVFVGIAVFVWCRFVRLVWGCGLVGLLVVAGCLFVDAIWLVYLQV